MSEELNYTEEQLEKAAHYWKDKDPKKYKAMLNELKRKRKTPGNKERGYQQVLQAKRRERGGSGTTAGQNGKSGHSSGKMNSDTATAVKRYSSAEKGKGKLSIDRKDNNKGYGSGNTRLVPQNLNRGRHNVDNKKLDNWKKRLKKYNMTIEDLHTLIKVRANEIGHEDLAKSIDIDTLVEMIGE
jgi:nitrogen fixation/metabolism regulation signal transduction histidine kinase